jgi:hypothetical protein
MENQFFSDNQKTAMREGAKQRKALIENTKEAAQRAADASILDTEEKIDTILSGPTGIGKTYNMLKALKEVGLEQDEDFVLLSGSHSMTQFAIKLMMSHRVFTLNKKSEHETLIVMVDDCDSFFQTKDSRNILKGMMGAKGTRKLQYNKMLPEHMLTDRQHAVLEHYRHSDGSPGFTIPCDDVAFVFTTNFVFPTERQAKAELDKGLTNRALTMQDLIAIRSRVKLKPFHMNKATNWGWLAEVALNDGLLDMLNDQPMPEFAKYQLLDFVANKWEQMTESNLRTITDMGLIMKKYGANARDYWATDFLVQNQTEILL